MQCYIIIQKYHFFSRECNILREQLYDPNFKNYSSIASGEAGSGGAALTAESYQLHIAAERVRPSELFFQPSLIG